jgi:MFS family permease
MLEALSPSLTVRVRAGPGYCGKQRLARLPIAGINIWTPRLLALVMEGYDTALLGAFYSLPPFRERFGTHLADGSYQITAPWMSALSNGSTCGSILGLFGSGIICDRYGYRKTMIGALMLMIVFIFPLFLQIAWRCCYVERSFVESRGEFFKPIR